MTNPGQRFDLGKIDPRAEVTVALLGKLNDATDPATNEVPDVAMFAALIEAIYTLEARVVAIMTAMQN